MEETAPLDFQTIQLPRDRDICVRFRRDSFVCSFADAGLFDREYGPAGEAYLKWLAVRIAEFPQGFVHIWRSGEIIGQIEMHPRGEPPVGYVNLFYLARASRGRGLGLSLHQYAVSIFKSAGVETMEQSVSPSNGRALAFYRKHGWQDLGPR